MYIHLIKHYPKQIIKPLIYNKNSVVFKVPYKVVKLNVEYYKINLNNHGKSNAFIGFKKLQLTFFRRSQVAELKHQNHELLERVHHLQNEVTESDMRRHELDNQLRNANTVYTK